MSGIVGTAGNTIKEIAFQLGKTVPESILFGTIVLYMITLSKAYGVFAVFILELILSHKCIAWIVNGTIGPDQVPQKSEACIAGFRTSRFPIAAMVPQHQYPSYGFFSIVSIATYLGMCTREFSDNIQSMGPQWIGRSFVAYLFIAIMILLFFIVRLVSGCEGPAELALAGGLGVLCGVVFFYVNSILFDREGLNFLGLPDIVSKIGRGANPIYVCSKNPST